MKAKAHEATASIPAAEAASIPAATIPKSESMPRYYTARAMVTREPILN